MGEGEQTSDGTPPDEWEYPKPESVIEEMYNKICEENDRKSKKGVLYWGERNGKWGWYKTGNEEKDTGHYVGDIENGVPNGHGIEIYGKGEITYVGEFKNGKRNGQGTSTSTNGFKYVGEWKDGGFWDGTYIHSNGIKEVGEFSHQLLLNGKKYDKDGKIIGTYVFGKKY